MLFNYNFFVRLSVLSISVILTACQVRSTVIGTSAESLSSTNQPGSVTKLRSHLRDLEALDAPISVSIVSVDDLVAGEPATFTNPNTVRVMGGEAVLSAPFASSGEVLVATNNCALQDNGACDFMAHDKELIDSGIEQFGEIIYEITHQFGGVPSSDISGFLYQGEVVIDDETFFVRGPVYRNLNWFVFGTSQSNPSRTIDMWADGSSLEFEVDPTTDTFMDFTGFFNIFENSERVRSQSFVLANASFTTQAHAVNAFTDDSDLFTLSLTKNPLSGFSLPFKVIADEYIVLSNQDGPASEPFNVVEILGDGGVIYKPAGDEPPCIGIAGTIDATWSRSAYPGSFPAQCAEQYGLPLIFLISINDLSEDAPNGNLLLTEISPSNFQPRPIIRFELSVTTNSFSTSGIDHSFIME